MRIARVHLPTVDSTNTYARAHVAEFDPAALTVVTADEQTAGRGRLGRVWVSSGAADVKATFAFAVPPAALPRAYQLSPLVAVAVVRALAGAGVAAAIKWPNDVIVSGTRKAGGILAELEGPPPGAPEPHYWAAVGVGLNVNSTPEALGVDRPLWPLSTLSAAAGRSFDVGALTDALAAAVAGTVGPFLAAGGDFSPWQAEYERASVLLGRRVRFAAGGGRTVVGVATGIGADGALEVDTGGGGGAAERFLAGEVTAIGLATPDGEYARDSGGEEVSGHPDGKE